MSGRQTYRARCGHGGCPEVAFYDGLTVRDRADLARRIWYCTRHRKAEEVLSAENSARTTVAVATRLIDGSDRLFWVPENEVTGSGFDRGPGFKAFADDFAEGTQLVVTAVIEPPTIPSPPPTSGAGAQSEETR